MEKLTLYEAMKAAGIEVDHHESDLYFRLNRKAVAIFNEHRSEHQTAKPFRSEVDGSLWAEVPFAYQPFWENVARVSI